MPSTRIGLGRLRLIEQGPTLDVQIGFDPEFRPSELARPNIPEVRFPALVDTGATESCIDSDLARVLQLPVVDRQAIAGVHGASETNVCLAQIHVPDLGFTMYGSSHQFTLPQVGCHTPLYWVGPSSSTSP